MFIKDIELKNFRNYKDLHMDLDPNVNLILGNNAQGKTNLIESIYITAVGKSFRTNRDSDLIKFDTDQTKVKVDASKKDEDISIEINILKGSKKAIRKNGIPISRTSELLNNIFIVVFSPEDLKIVKDEPEKRRKFIDRELCQISPRYCDSLINYKKILTQRNAYLKEKEVDMNLLDLWDSQLSMYGASIIKIREKFIKKISKYSNEIHTSITGGIEDLVINYKPSVEVQEDEKSQKEFFYKTLKENVNNDIKNRTTGVGPHKDDITFFVGNINMRNFGSQGQQRTCALSLKLAELNLIKEETYEDAILILDDVMSELDLNRQEYLIKTLKENQLFITTTEIDKKIKEKFREASVFYVKNGSVEKA